MKLNKLAILALSISLAFTSCSNDDDSTVTVEPILEYVNGIIITEEGNFTNGTGAISFVSNDLEYVENTVFENVNEETLGNLVQSMAFDGSLGYIIENGSNALKVVNRYTFQAITTISSGLDNPRYMTVVNGKGYITNWGDGNDETDDYVAVLDLNTNTFVSQIPVAFGPEAIVSLNDNIYVAHQGGFTQNNQLTVINAVSDEVITTLTVGDVPNSLQIDESDTLWVLCGGNPNHTANETDGALYKINTSTNTITSSITFDEGLHPSNLYYDTNNLYYGLSGDVYKMSSAESTLPEIAEFSVSNLYDFSVRGNQLFALDHNVYSSETSYLKVFSLDTNSEIKSIDLGPFAGEVYFNN
ncbi:YncE family protein [Olleya sp. YSTF-M6]|uniref:YncE family protein n=1 Tax=Olleya sediminilitoris TaxID=2795739 RepID=A0ABS1WJU5_9FLAO|nr:DUF5074 domain-containing protein [Olleya sediminilitoris]MBL7559396.1 YncE family protein [Olleya sediminilitoris]